MKSNENDENVAKMREEIFGDTMKLLDQIIIDRETQLNKNASISPFQGMYVGSNQLKNKQKKLSKQQKDAPKKQNN